MAPVLPPAKVLVTGANGYIAIWIVRVLLERGYSGRGTVRSESKTKDLRRLFKNELDNGKLEIVIVPDITVPGAFDESVKGVDAIEHTASPFHLKGDDPNGKRTHDIYHVSTKETSVELIEPAVKGTSGIMESALKHA